MTEAEKRAYLKLLRAEEPMSHAARTELATILERQWFPDAKGGRPPLTPWGKANSGLRALGLKGLYEQARQEIGKEGGRPTRDAAIARAIQNWEKQKAEGKLPDDAPRPTEATISNAIKRIKNQGV